MTTLLALGFPYSTSANAAAQDIVLQEPDLATEPEAVAVVSCDDDGAFHVTTTHTLGKEGHRFFWQLLLTALIFLPASPTIDEQELRAFCRRLEELGFDPSFQERLREMLAPDTSALFLLTSRSVPADALTALGRFGGNLLAAPLAPDIEIRIMNALHETSEFEAVPLDAMVVDEDPPSRRFPRALPKSRPSLDAGGSSGAHETPQDHHPRAR
jgi:uncharacterized membrane protein